MTGTAVVTGAEGFIGSHLVEALVRDGARVRALVQYNSFSSWGWLEKLDDEVVSGVEIVLGDVRDPGCVMALLRDVEVVYHLAALIAIPYSYRAPTSYLETNAGGTLNILEAARALGTPRVIHTSTSEVYGTARTVPITETHPLQAQSPYAASKIAADKLAESYHLSYSCPVVTLRPFNTYGPRQSARAVIPTVVSQLAAGRQEIRLGSTAPTRDFNYVTDTAEAFLAVGRAPDDVVLGRVFNAGSGQETSIGDVVSMIAATLGRNVTIVTDDERVRPHASEVMRLVCDSSELRRATGWKPSLSLADGIEKTCSWMLRAENLAAYKDTQYNI